MSSSIPSHSQATPLPFEHAQFTHPASKHRLPLAASLGSRMRRGGGERGGVPTGSGGGELVRPGHAY